MKPQHFPLLHSLRQKLFGERNNHGPTLGTGLLRDELDERDFKLGIFGWSDYQPKYQHLEIPTLSLKNQGSFNTCVLNSATVQKELDEKLVLSVRFLVCLARREGMLQGNGFSSLRDIQKLIQKFGICEAPLFPEGDANLDWDSYADVTLLTPERIANAALHKSSTYFYTISRNDTLKMLDEGKTLHTGMPWYQGFNMGGGFSWPWLIWMVKGFLVGGHAFLITGYDLNYQNKKSYIVQNSYGFGWGDKGKFYVEMDFFDKVGYERYVQIDLPLEIAKIISEHQGQFVKDISSSAIYFITNNTKRAFPDMTTFIAFGGYKKKYTEINSVALAQIPDGPVMDIKQSPYWNDIHTLDQKDWRDALTLIISKK